MPFKKKTYKKRRRFYRRRRRRYPFLARTPFPAIQYARLPYVHELAINATASPTLHTFVANGLFDPDLTGSGHAPLGFNQYMLRYNHYEVLGSQIIAKFVPNGTVECHVGVYRDDNASASSSLTELLEQTGSKYRTVTLNSTSPVTIKQSYSQRKAFGKSARGTHRHLGDSSANPLEKQYYMVWQNGISAGDPTGITVLIRINYIVKFSELKTLASS